MTRFGICSAHHLQSGINLRRTQTIGIFINISVTSTWLDNNDNPIGPAVVCGWNMEAIFLALCKTSAVFTSLNMPVSCMFITELREVRRLTSFNSMVQADFTELTRQWQLKKKKMRDKSTTFQLPENRANMCRLIGCLQWCIGRHGQQISRVDGRNGQYTSWVWGIYIANHM